MAQLKLSELSPVGSDLFRDSETFLEELSDRELDFVSGGDDVATLASNSVGSINTISVVGISQTNVSVNISGIDVDVSNVNVPSTLP